MIESKQKEFQESDLTLRTLNAGTLKVSTISPFAHEWFSHTDKAQVLQVFKQSCNFVNVHKELLSLVLPEVGPGPFSAVVLHDDALKGRGGFSDWVKVNHEVRIEAGRMLLGNVVVEVKNAEVWDPKPDWENIHNHGNWIMAMVPKLIKFLHEEAPPDSLFQIADDLVDGKIIHLQRVQPSVEIRNTFSCAAIEPARFLLKGIAKQQKSFWKRGLYELLGLGGGLTPAGDDFILGVIFAMWIMLPRTQSEDIFFSVRQLAEQRTNQLSAAYLRAAAKGEASFPWHSFFEAIISENANVLYRAVRSILHFGHTSGSDALTGFVCMMGQFG